MTNIKENCENIQKHIKKADRYLGMFMYNDDGLAYILMQPFIYLHKKHFREVTQNVENIKKYVEDNNLKINIESFEEHINSSVLYNQSQIASLTSKQFEYRVKYLENLNHKIEELKKII